MRDKMNEFQFSSLLVDVQSGTENDTNESFFVGYRQSAYFPPWHSKKAEIIFLLLRGTWFLKLSRSLSIVF